MNETDFPFHAKSKELIKMKMTDVLSFFGFDKFNLECTKLLNSHYDYLGAPSLLLLR